MSTGLQVPGRANVRFVTHDDVDSASTLNLQVAMPGGGEVHTAGGYTRLEAAALEIAKSFAAGLQGELPEPVKFGEWAAQVASAAFEKCRQLNQISERS